MYTKHAKRGIETDEPTWDTLLKADHVYALEKKH
jgi:hypothetical protein